MWVIRTLHLPRLDFLKTCNAKYAHLHLLQIMNCWELASFNCLRISFTTHYEYILAYYTAVLTHLYAFLSQAWNELSNLLVVWEQFYTTVKLVVLNSAHCPRPIKAESFSILGVGIEIQAHMIPVWTQSCKVWSWKHEFQDQSWIHITSDSSMVCKMEMASTYVSICLYTIYVCIWLWLETAVVHVKVTY